MNKKKNDELSASRPTPPVTHDNRLTVYQPNNPSKHSIFYELITTNIISRSSSRSAAARYIITRRRSADMIGQNQYSTASQEKINLTKRVGIIKRSNYNVLPHTILNTIHHKQNIKSWKNAL